MESRSLSDSPPSPLARAGSVVISLARHVLVRAVLWGVIGLVVGIVCFAGLVLIYNLADRSRILGAVVLLLYAGVAVFAFGAHGITRGLARAALQLEGKFGILRYLIDRLTASIERRLGSTIANLPLARFEEASKEIVAQYLGSDEMLEGSGPTRWVLTKVRALLVRRIEAFLLKAYRAEAEEGGGGGGVSIARVRERMHAELPGQLAGLVMGAVNKHLVILLVGYVAIALGWLKIVRLFQ